MGKGTMSMKFNKNLVTAVLLILGAALLFFGIASGKNKESDIDEANSMEKYREQLEGMLRSVEGIGEVRVMINGKNANGEFKITGVAVICRGAENPRVQKDIVGIISSLCGIPTNRIYVTAMK